MKAALGVRFTLGLAAFLGAAFLIEAPAFFTGASSRLISWWRVSLQQVSSLWPFSDLLFCSRSLNTSGKTF